MPTSPRVYSYLRFSTPEQSLGRSEKRQLARAEEWASARNYIIVESMADLGVSGFRGKHRSTGALGKFLELVKSGGIDSGSILLIESLDRLSREAEWKVISLMADIINAGVKIVTLDDGEEYSDSSDNMSLMRALMVCSRAHGESKRKSDFGKQSWKAKRREAREGKVITRALPEWLTVDDGAIVPIPERVALLKEMFTLSARGVGRRRIVKMLNERGEKPWGKGKKAAKMWHDSYISKLLKWPAVVGEYQPRELVYDEHGEKSRPASGEPIKDYYPQVIDPELYADAQAAARSRRQRGGRQGKNRNNLLSGLVRCGECGGTMVYENKGKRGGAHKLVCYASTRQAGCSHSYRYTYTGVEYAAYTGLSEGALRALVADEKDYLGSLQLDLRRVESKIETVSEDLTALLENFSARVPEISKKIDSLANKKEQLIAAAAALKNEIKQATSLSRVDLDEVFQLIRSIKKVEGAASDSERYVIRSEQAMRLRQVIESITCQDGHAEILYRDGSTSVYDDVQAKEIRRAMHRTGLKRLQDAISS